MTSGILPSTVTIARTLVRSPTALPLATFERTDCLDRAAMIKTR